MAKILVSMDERLLAQIDKAARSLGLTRSAYLSRLAAREVEGLQGPGRSAASRNALLRIDELFALKEPAVDLTRVVRQERDSH